MKRLFFLLCLAGFSRLALSQTAPPTLRYHWVAGDVFSAVETSLDKTHQQSDSGNEEAEQNSETKFGHTWKVQSVTADGTATISSSIDFARIEVEVNRVPVMVVDTLAPAANVGDARLLSVVSDYMGALKASPLTLKISSSGDILAVNGIDDLTDRLREVAEKDKTKFKIEDRIGADQLMEALVSSETSPKTYSFMLVSSPAKAVSIGDSWTQKLEMPFPGMSLQITRSQRVREISTHTVSLDVDTAVEFPSKAESPYQVESVPGSAAFSRKAGLLEKIEWGFLIKGPVMAQKDGKNVRVGHSEETIQTRFELSNQQSPAEEFNSPEYHFSANFPCTVQEQKTNASEGSGKNLAFLAPADIMMFECFRKDRFTAGVQVADSTTPGATVLEQVVDQLKKNPLTQVTAKQVGTFEGYPSIKIDSELRIVAGITTHAMVVATGHRVYRISFTQFAPDPNDEAAGKTFFQSFHIHSK